jgi:glutamyl/glutaminyl-tRNA synthetase
MHSLFESEFEETILEDLDLLDIKGDTVTHTSDYFDQIYELGVKIIKTGKAYADDTEQAQVALSCLPRQTYGLTKATDAGGAWPRNCI